MVGGQARVGGVGERVTPMPFVAHDYLLVLPPFGVDTAAVFGAWDAGHRGGEPNGLTAAALAVEPRLARWRDALGELTGMEPVLAGSGSTWFVEGGPPEAGMPSAPALRLGDETGRLVRGADRAGGLGGRLRGRERSGEGATCRPGVASGWPSASSCASSCASACDAS